jgi:hypothetical protein
MKQWTFSLLAVLGTWVMSSHAATVNSIETWSGSNTDGWVAYDLVNEVVVSDSRKFMVSNQVMAVVFKSYFDRFNKPLMPMPPEKYLIKADVTASSGVFAGDYLSQGVGGVTFRIYCDYPTETWLAFRNVASTRYWQLSLGIQATGSWQTVTVPILPSVLRELYGASDWASLEQDLKNVSWIGVIIRRNSSLNGQAVLMDDFSLTGPGADFAAWMAQYANTGTWAAGETPLPDGDLDGDGVANVSEWVAGTSAVDSNDCLRLSIEPGAQNRPRLRWNAKAGRVYNVWRCSDLKQGFNRISSDVRGQSTSGDTTFEDSAVEGPAFYRIDVRGTP